MKKDFFTRYEVSEDGVKEIKVPRIEAEERINKMLERDKELLDILEKL